MQMPVAEGSFPMVIDKRNQAEEIQLKYMNVVYALWETLQAVATKAETLT